MTDFAPISLSVELVGQPTRASCWAASMAMILGARDSASYTADAVAQAASMNTNDGYNWDAIRNAVQVWQLNELGPACALPEAWAEQIRSHGPIWVVEIGAPYHAVVVTGVDGDGTPEGSHVLVNDPQPPSKESRPFVDFENDFELGSGSKAQMISA